MEEERKVIRVGDVGWGQIDGVKNSVGSERTYDGRVRRKHGVIGDDAWMDGCMY